MSSSFILINLLVDENLLIFFEKVLSSFNSFFHVLLNENNLIFINFYTFSPSLVNNGVQIVPNLQTSCISFLYYFDILSLPLLFSTTIPMNDTFHYLYFRLPLNIDSDLFSMWNRHVSHLSLKDLVLLVCLCACDRFQQIITTFHLTPLASFRVLLNRHESRDFNILLLYHFILNCRGLINNFPKGARI